MLDYYKKFDYDYNQSQILDLCKNLINEKKYHIKHPWFMCNADEILKNQSILPMSDILGRELSNEDCGLSMMIGSTNLHTNPNSNGLIIFPLDNNLNFTFDPDIEVLIDKPTAINGKMLHKYRPVKNITFFYAIKIPSSIDWNTISSRIDNACK